eukprot:m.85808 g.85808  ORF g.85808 m.85808 type:complete len:347 (+) comp14854_c0_seq1:193-1233(+)
MGCCEPTFPGWLDCYRLLRLDGLFDLGFGDFLDAGLCIDNVCLGLDARPAWRAVDHGLQLRAELILQALTMLDQQNMKVVLDGIRNRGFKMRMALVTGRRLGHPPQLQRKFPDMGVDGNDVAAETEHENTGNRLFPNALEAAEKPVHVSVVYVAQKLKRWLHVRQALDNMPLFNQRRTHRPNTLGLDRCKIIMMCVCVCGGATNQSPTHSQRQASTSCHKRQGHSDANSDTDQRTNDGWKHGAAGFVCRYLRVLNRGSFNCTATLHAATRPHGADNTETVNARRGRKLHDIARHWLGCDGRLRWPRRPGRQQKMSHNSLRRPEGDNFVAASRLDGRFCHLAAVTTI